MSKVATCLIGMACLMGIGICHPVHAQPKAVGSEFQINSSTSSDQTRPAIAVESDGDFVVVWDGPGAVSEIFARRFASNGVPLGGEFQVNAHTTGQQYAPAIAIDGDGDFVVSWMSSGQDGSLGGVFARRLNAAGVAQATEFQVNSYTAGNQVRPSLAADDAGTFVVTWMSQLQDGSLDGIFARRFSSSGGALGIEFQVSSYTAASQNGQAIAMDADGDFVIAWASYQQDGSSGGIFGRRWNTAGIPQGIEFRVNSHTEYSQHYPAVGMASDGAFVIVWQSFAQDGSYFGVFGRRFTATGTGLGPEFQVNAYTSAPQYNVSVAMENGGGFVVTWDDNGARDGEYQSIFARRFGVGGAPQGPDFQVSSYTLQSQFNTTVGAAAGGAFVVAWQSFFQDGSAQGIFGQRYAPITLDVDDDGAVTALTDGVLILRSLFGFTGATLTSAAIGTACWRCTASGIDAYITGLGAQLDVDGNTMIGPLTDGLLVVRYLFGFTGSTLTTGAVGGGCSRCEAGEIADYLDGLAS